ncbi:hypothetical protein GCM10011507_34490 [Edaphobacter acidisoli]|uniref:Microcin J25-processing protein McjB C-terminal domain-containing protein n=1 Tax=Edaphobacter acidisoli TaxID=2040573 RepID=A0A916WA32_9BACT|nr:lasso peptide biosynthesis B2 protein [Edaphobacter acidisoli]GGA80345.1 hypothetical protein GCM10011507_34490 [Edaphobacter acidisoli]
MGLLVFEAYVRLIAFDLYLRRGSFSALYERVRGCPVRIGVARLGSVERICAAVDLATIWYWKEVLCLQRSAATVCMLRKHGIPAELVIGAQSTPFKAHAWVEADGSVVNDKPYMPTKYTVLDRC